METPSASDSGHLCYGEYGESSGHWWLPYKGPVIQSVGVSFVVSLNMLLETQSSYRFF